MNIKEKIKHYTNVLVDEMPDEAVLALYNMLVEHMHKFKLQEHLVDDSPY